MKDEKWEVVMAREPLDAIAIDGTDFESLIRWGTDKVVALTISDGDDQVSFSMETAEQRKAAAAFFGSIAERLSSGGIDDHAD